MNNTVVIYASNYGHTKKYAEYIAKQLDCEVFNAKDIKSNKLNDYQNIIFGSGVYAGKMNKADFINKNVDKLENKNVIIFSVCLTQARNADEKMKIESYLNDSINNSVDIKKHFNFPGGINHDKLNFIHKMMMKAAKQMMKKDLENAETDAFGQNHDFTDLNKADELIEYLRNL